MTKNPIKIATVSLVALSTLTSTVCAAEYPSAWFAGGDSSIKHTISDTSITAAIKSRYIADPEIKGLNIHVVTVKGVVTLSGHVPNQIMGNKAIQLAQDTDGVQEVISNIKIKETSTANNVISDSAITAAIKSKYLADSKVKGLQIHVTTINGKVTLTGQVPNDDMEENAIAIARDTDGVKEVISKLEVKP